MVNTQPVSTQRVSGMSWLVGLPLMFLSGPAAFVYVPAGVFLGLSSLFVLADGYWHDQNLAGSWITLHDREWGKWSRRARFKHALMLMVMAAEIIFGWVLVSGLHAPPVWENIDYIVVLIVVPCVTWIFLTERTLPDRVIDNLDPN